MNYYSFSEQAIKDLNEICNYIAEGNAKAASRLFDEIRKKCKLVANFPNMGKRYDKLMSNLRGFMVENYIVFYYPSEKGIYVLRVVSGYRDLESLFSDNEEN